MLLVVSSAECGGERPWMWCGSAGFRCYLVVSGFVSACQLARSQAGTLRHMGAFTNQKSLDCATASVTAPTIRCNFTGTAIFHHERQEIDLAARE